MISALGKLCAAARRGSIYDKINGKSKIGHSKSPFAIKYLGILLFFVLLILTFFLPFPLLESSVLLPEEDHFMPEPMVCSTAYNPYQYKQAPPTHVILNAVDIIIAKISKNNSRFGSCIHYFLISTSLKSTKSRYLFQTKKYIFGFQKKPKTKKIIFFGHSTLFQNTNQNKSGYG